MPSRLFFLKIDYKRILYETYELENDKKDNIQIVETIEDKMTYFYDSNKIKTSMHISMYDIASQFILPDKIDKPCWWCGYTFNTSPIGIFLNHVSPINDTIKGKLKLKNIDTDYYFETEGICCSLPCNKAFVIDESARYPVKYKRSLALLSLFQQKVFDHKKSIPTAGNWRLLEKWGGPMTIEEYRKTFGITEYVLTSNQKRQVMFIVGNYIEENKFV